VIAPVVVPLESWPSLAMASDGSLSEVAHEGESVVVEIPKRLEQRLESESIDVEVDRLGYIPRWKYGEDVSELRPTSSDHESESLSKVQPWQENGFTRTPTTTPLAASEDRSDSATHAEGPASSPRSQAFDCSTRITSVSGRTPS
jgi:hypothetical protein